MKKRGKNDALSPDGNAPIEKSGTGKNEKYAEFKTLMKEKLRLKKLIDERNAEINTIKTILLNNSDADLADSHIDIHQLKNSVDGSGSPKGG